MESWGYLETGTNKLNALKIISVTIDCPSEWKTLLLNDMESGNNRTFLYMHICLYSTAMSHIICSLMFGKIEMFSPETLG